MADRKKTNRKNGNKSSGKSGGRKPALKTEVEKPFRLRDLI